MGRGVPPRHSSRPQRFGELAPHWIAEGGARIERYVFPYPLSRDLERYRRLKDDMALYRLTFGPPRQEDMIELLRREASTSTGPSSLGSGWTCGPDLLNHRRMVSPDALPTVSQSARGSAVNRRFLRSSSPFR